MRLYAIEIVEQNLDLIALLNQGVIPSERSTTALSYYFLFDAEWNSETPNRVLTDSELIKNFEFEGRPLIYQVK